MTGRATADRVANRNRVTIGGLPMVPAIILMALILATVIGTTASANPIAPRPESIGIDDPFTLVLLLGLINLPLDILMLALMFLAAARLLPKDLIGVCNSTRDFMLRFLAAGLLMVACGASIDAAILYHAQTGWAADPDYEVYVLQDPILPYALLAGLLVLLSVAAVCMFILRMGPKASAVLGAVIAMANVFAWSFQAEMGPGGDLLFLVTFAAFALSPAAFALVRRWHISTCHIRASAVVASLEASPSAK